MEPDKIAQAYETLIRRFTDWAEAEDNVRAAFIFGSRARSDHPADAWSDLDLLLLCRDAEPIWASTDWLDEIGNAWITFLEPTPDHQGFERRVLFEGGVDVDFVPTHAAGFVQMAKSGFPPDLADMIHRGIRILVDKDGIAELVDPERVTAPPYTPPTESEFLNLVNDFWYHTVWTAKHLRRGELWWAKSCCDCYLKDRLRQLLAWHARATQGHTTETWLRGRFLEEWADPRATLALTQAFAHYNEDDVWRALRATMMLFSWLARETAEHSGYRYPSRGEAHARDLVETLEEGRVR